MAEILYYVIIHMIYLSYITHDAVGQKDLALTSSLDSNAAEL